MNFFGWFFIISTVILTIFKKEKMVDVGDIPEGLLETYQHVVAIFRLKPVQQLSFLLLTCRIAFAPADAVSGFKLQVQHSIGQCCLLVRVFSQCCVWLICIESVLCAEVQQ